MAYLEVYKDPTWKYCFSLALLWGASVVVFLVQQSTLRVSAVHTLVSRLHAGISRISINDGLAIPAAKLVCALSRAVTGDDPKRVQSPKIVGYGRKSRHFVVNACKFWKTGGAT